MCFKKIRVGKSKAPDKDLIDTKNDERTELKRRLINAINVDEKQKIEVKIESIEGEI